MRSIYLSRRVYMQYHGALSANAQEPEQAEVRMELANEMVAPPNQSLPVVMVTPPNQSLPVPMVAPPNQSLPVPTVTPPNQSLPVPEYRAPSGVRSGQQQTLWTRARATISRGVSALTQRLRGLYYYGAVCALSTGIAFILVFLFIVISSYFRTKTPVNIPEKIPDVMVVVPKPANNGDKSPIEFEVMNSGHYKDMVEAILTFLKSKNGTAASNNGSIN